MIEARAVLGTDGALVYASETLIKGDDPTVRKGVLTVTAGTSTGAALTTVQKDVGGGVTISGPSASTSGDVSLIGVNKSVERKVGPVKARFDFGLAWGTNPISANMSLSTDNKYVGPSRAGNRRDRLGVLSVSRGR